MTEPETPDADSATHPEQPPTAPVPLVTAVPGVQLPDPEPSFSSGQPMIDEVPARVLEDPDPEDAVDESVDPTPPAVIDVPRFCPGCGSQVAGHELFCESCGLPLTPVSAPLTAEGSVATAATQPMATPRRAAPADCAECGGEVDGDGYCTICGTKSRPERDHYEESPAEWLAGVCDRGVRHSRNEDALALAVDALGRGIMVVCDGVSTSEDSDIASLAAARAARDLLVAEPTDGQGTVESRVNAISACLVDATIAANAAVVNSTHPDSVNTASCTIVAALVRPGEVHVAHLGDSRLYWFGDDGTRLLLTEDDSVAQARIAMGVSRQEAETGYQAHAITRWLGRDSEDIIPHTSAHALNGAGWLLACSDGLWNYASDPQELWVQFATVLAAESTLDPARRSDDDGPATGAGDDAPMPLAVASALVTWANHQGGRDNVTVALARIEPAPQAPATEE